MVRNDFSYRASEIVVKSPYPNLVQEDLQEERHGDGEDGAAGGDEPVGEAEVPLEVVADDGEGRRVGERGARPEQHAVGQIQWDNLRGERAGLGTSSPNGLTKPT